LVTASTADRIHSLFPPALALNIWVTSIFEARHGEHEREQDQFVAGVLQTDPRVGRNVDGQVLDSNRFGKLKRGLLS